MQNNKEDKTQLQQAILNVLHYFDVFHFPLRLDEIQQFIQLNCDDQQLVIALNDLVSQQEIYQLNDCYSLHDNLELVARKNAGFKLAQHKINRAKKSGISFNVFHLCAWWQFQVLFQKGMPINILILIFSL